MVKIWLVPLPLFLMIHQTLQYKQRFEIQLVVFRNDRSHSSCTGLEKCLCISPFPGGNIYNYERIVR